MSRWVLLLSVLTLALALAGCGSGVPASTSPPAPSVSGGASATPSPEATHASETPPAASQPVPSVEASPSGDPVLVGAGDIAVCGRPDDEATADLIDGIPGIVFALGDTAYDSGSEAELRDCYGPSWGRFKDRTGFAVTGNHDIRTDDGAPLIAYFGDAAARDGVTWFSEDVGAWHLIVLDTNCGHLDGGCGPDSAQVRWLRDDLAASGARCTLAMWHHPRFSSGTHGNDKDVAPLWDVLYAAGADLVLNGHDHDYERFYPQDPEGRPDADRGITEIVVGTGGAELRGFEKTAPNAVARSSDAHGVIELTLAADGWAFRFVSTDDTFSDQGRGVCH